MEVNKNISVPLYLQISQFIKKNIDSGVYDSNQLLPSEMDIQKQFSVSRITARKAYKILMDQGIIRGVQGKGTYVNNLQENDWTWMKHFTQEIKSMGHEPSSKIISFMEVLAKEEVSRILELEERAPVYYLKRIRCIDNIPIWLTRTYIPVEVAEGFSKEYFSEKGSAQSIFFILEKEFGVEFSTDITIDYPSEIPLEDLNILYIDKNKPIEKSAHVVKNRKGIPLVYEKTIFEQTIVKKNETR